MDIERRADNKLVLKLLQEVEETFSPENLALHEKYIDAISEIYCDEIAFYLVEGFKLGLRIGIDL